MAGKLRRVLLCGFAVCLALWVGWALLWRYGTHAEVRTDTGDVRLCFLGVPYKYHDQAAANGAALLEAARLTPPLRSEWLKCGDIADDVYLVCFDEFAIVSAWSSVDPRITRLMMEDVIGWVRRTEGLYRLPRSIVSWRVVSGSPARAFTLAPDWRADPFVRDYLESRGYELPPEER